ncbi:carboxypeptidase s [Coprinopsis marcescibilis]|uniref:Carboxypeptidase s n=1 Tax=Coprinopsis marcescibilis TaxID=230819 RepID=A0A5C3L085_COPMA|nr:carboxypeptidase s [Coprinopsis marcescibilis]
MDLSSSNPKALKARKRVRIRRNTQVDDEAKGLKSAWDSGNWYRPLLRIFILLNAAYFTYLLAELLLELQDPYSRELKQCHQPTALTPTRHLDLWKQLNTDLTTDSMRNKVVSWLANAIRLPTETFDDMGNIGEDGRWNNFIPFQEYLKDTFPLVHSSLELTKVNTFGLLYEWKGQHQDLKPMLLAAHQDVVPVEHSTIDEWVHPPFSGTYDGERIWGRGSSDDKGSLISILSAVEMLLDSGFKPTRSLILAFGFDEEASGFHGAGHLAGAIKDKYGEKGVAMIVDEGAGFYDEFGSAIALPGITEKGLYNIRLQVQTPGGHSSVPPDHTSIGILSEMVTYLENHPLSPSLDRRQPLFRTLQCVAQHAKEVPRIMRRTITMSFYSKVVLLLLQRQFMSQKLFRSLVGTTQAVDMIHGGIKNNALPETAWAVFNHRISVTSSLADIQRRYRDLLQPLAFKHNLRFTAFGDIVGGEDLDSSHSLIVMNATLHGLEPAPVTPTGQGSTPYLLLAGTIKATYGAHRGFDNAGGLVIAPSMMPGNTDTRYYWDLTDHIFRYNHYHNLNPKVRGVHTVNEYIPADVLVEMIRFFVTIILNADESTTL